MRDDRRGGDEEGEPDVLVFLWFCGGALPLLLVFLWLSVLLLLLLLLLWDCEIKVPPGENRH